MASASPAEAGLAVRSASPISITPSRPASASERIPLDQPQPKLKGRRLLQNLQRMSSNPIITRRNRSASTGYTRGGEASLSCVSLSSSSHATCFGDSSASQLYDGLDIHSTTIRASGTSQPGHAPVARIRILDGSSSIQASTRTAGVPVALNSGPPGSAADWHTATGGTASPGPEKEVFDFWGSLPSELKMDILRYLTAKEIIRCSAVSKSWYKMCYDGQLWSDVDTTDYYRDITGESLVKIITSGGPFLRDLNLRGCIQLRDKLESESERISDICRNVVNLSVQGSRIDKSSVHYFLLRNPRLEHIDLSTLPSVTNSAMKIIADTCPQLESLNVSWCSSVDTVGLKKIVKSCLRLKDLRASEIRGFDDEDFALQLFERNTLERLVMSRTDLTDQSLKILMHGVDPAIDLLTDRPIVPPRRLKHLDFQQCVSITDRGARSLAYNVPDLEGLQISQCSELTDDTIIDIIHTVPMLTHLELEDLENLTNAALIEIAKSPCAFQLEHLNISYCESLGDIGLLQIMKSCPKIRSVEMDNTRVSDLTLMEASSRIRKRGYGGNLPQTGLRLVVFDCPNVTWAGVREVLSSNCYVPRSRKSPTAVAVLQTAVDSAVSLTSPPSTPPPPQQVYPNFIIQLKCFYGWQMTVDEHTKRVLRGDLAAASRLDRRWADYMMVTEEAGATGAGARRRRRRAREAERLYNLDEDDEDEDAYDTGGLSSLGGRRRRAQSGGCTLM